MTEPFGFRVQYHGPKDWDPDARTGWSVSLPHQCDRWDIAGEAYDPVPQQEAVELLARFVAEAQEALTALREGRTVYIDDPYEVDW